MENQAGPDLSVLGVDTVKQSGCQEAWNSRALSTDDVPDVAIDTAGINARRNVAFLHGGTTCI